MIVLGICRTEKEKCPIIYQTQKISNNEDNNMFDNNMFDNTILNKSEEPDDYIHNIL